MKCTYYKIMYCSWNEHLSSNPIKCVYHILSLNCLETDQIKGIKTLQICSCFEVLVLCQSEVIDISSPWHHSPLGRSTLISNCFALEPPSSIIIKFSETNLCWEAGGQVNEQETDLRNWPQKGAGVIEQDWTNQKKINRKEKKFLSIRRTFLNKKNHVKKFPSIRSKWRV